MTKDELLARLENIRNVLESGDIRGTKIRLLNLCRNVRHGTMNDEMPESPERPKWRYRRRSLKRLVGMAEEEDTVEVRFTVTCLPTIDPTFKSGLTEELAKLSGQRLGGKDGSVYVARVEVLLAREENWNLIY